VRFRKYDDEVPAGEPEWEGECGWDVPALPLPVLGKHPVTSLPPRRVFFPCHPVCYTSSGLLFLATHPRWRPLASLIPFHPAI
jgi:hypothetical protein